MRLLPKKKRIEGNGMNIIETLTEKFPVRKSAREKAAFREWVTDYIRSMGYQVSADGKGYSRNVVAGDPEQAKVIFTAHYDTQPVMPIPNFITPTNVWIYLAYQLLMTIAILAAGCLAGGVVLLLGGHWGLAYMVTMLSFFALLFLMLFGPANRHCVNDNTSGVAAVLELMQRLPQEQRTAAAFILFDNEEKGLLGSFDYAGKHKQIRKEKLLINMDCVGDGENLLFFANRKTRALPCFPLLEEAMAAQTGRRYIMNRMEKCIYPSDQQAFTYGIAVCACLRSERWGFYLDKIHTKHDTVCHQENLDFLARGLTAFVEKL